MEFHQIESAILNGRLATGANSEDVVLFVLYKHLFKGLMELSNEVLKPFGLSQVSFTTLMALRTAPDNALNPSLLCEISGESRANMTRIGNELVGKGLIQRVPSVADRRRLVLSLTPAGQRLIRRLLPKLWGRLTPAFDVFSAAETKQLTSLLKRQLGVVEAIL